MCRSAMAQAALNHRQLSTDHRHHFRRWCGRTRACRARCLASKRCADHRRIARIAGARRGCSGRTDARGAPQAQLGSVVARIRFPMHHDGTAGPGWWGDSPFSANITMRTPPMIPTNHSLARLTRPTAEVVVVCRGRCRISAYSVRAEKSRETPCAASRRRPCLQVPGEGSRGRWHRAAAQGAA